MRERGFSLLEVLIGLSILATAALASVHLLSAAAAMVRDSRVQSVAGSLAAQRMEQLLALDWDDVALAPGGALDANVDGYFDYLDGEGRALAGAPFPALNAVYVRRWTIDPLPDRPDRARAIRVLVRAVAADNAGSRGSRGEARLVTLRARTAR